MNQLPPTTQIPVRQTGRDYFESVTLDRHILRVKNPYQTVEFYCTDENFLRWKGISQQTFSDIADLQKQVGDLHGALASREATIRNLHEEYKSQSKRINSANDQCDCLQRNLDRLRQTRKDEETRTAVIIEQRDILEKTVKDLRERASRQTHEIQSLLNELENIKECHANQRKTILEYMNSTDALKDQLREAQKNAMPSVIAQRDESNSKWVINSIFQQIKLVSPRADPGDLIGETYRLVNKYQEQNKQLEKNSPELGESIRTMLDESNLFLDEPSLVERVRRLVRSFNTAASDIAFKAARIKEHQEFKQAADTQVRYLQDTLCNVRNELQEANRTCRVGEAWLSPELVKQIRCAIRHHVAPACRNDFANLSIGDSVVKFFEYLSSQNNSVATTLLDCLTEEERNTKNSGTLFDLAQMVVGAVENLRETTGDLNERIAGLERDLNTTHSGWKSTAEDLYNQRLRLMFISHDIKTAFPGMTTNQDATESVKTVIESYKAQQEKVKKFLYVFPYGAGKTKMVQDAIDAGIPVKQLSPNVQGQAVRFTVAEGPKLSPEVEKIIQDDIMRRKMEAMNRKIYESTKITAQDIIDGIEDMLVRWDSDNIPSKPNN